MKTVNGCKDVSIMAQQDENGTVCSQNINKQNVNIADEILTDGSFLSRYHYTKSKNYLKKRYIKFVTEFHVYWDTLYFDFQ